MKQTTPPPHRHHHHHQGNSLQRPGVGSTVQTSAHMQGASPNRCSTKPAGLTPSQGSSGPDAGPREASTWHPDPAQTHCVWPVCATIPQGGCDGLTRRALSRKALGTCL